MSLRPSSTRAEVRKKSYKTGVDADEARRRREDNLVEIRKNKREDNLLKNWREGLQGLPSQPMQQLLDASQNAAALEKRNLVLEDVMNHYWYKWCESIKILGWLGFYSACYNLLGIPDAAKQLIMNLQLLGY
ncbi:importin subunit alpha-4 [Fagus crenata]